MKRFILSLILFISVVSFSSAQIRLGVKAGANISDVHIDADDDSWNKKVGAHLGVYGQYFLSDQVAIQGELLYSNEGINYDLVGSDEEGKWVLNYLQVPILVRYQLGPSFNIHAGPQLGISLGGKDKINDNDDSIDNLNGFIFGLAGGLGYNFTEKLELGARYTTSLSDLMDDEVEPKITSQVIQVFVAFQLK